MQPITSTTTRESLDYEFKDWAIGFEPRLTYVAPGDIQPTVGLDYVDSITGTNLGIGLSGLFNVNKLLQSKDPIARLKSIISAISLRFGGVQLGVGYSGNAGFSTTLGIGALNYTVGAGLGVGIYNIGSSSIVSANVPYYLAAAAVCSFITAAIGGSSPEQIFDRVFGTVLETAIPATPVRELISFFDYALSSPTPQTQAKTIHELNNVLSRMGSYGNKGLVYTALSKIDDLLAGSADPYFNATLRQKKDTFLMMSKSVLFPITPSVRHDSFIEDPADTIADNIRMVVNRVKQFRLHYSDWSRNAGISETTPANGEVLQYMEDILYLSKKLPMSVETEKADAAKGTKELYSIVSNTGFCTDDPEIMTDYLEELSSVFLGLTTPESGLYQFLQHRFENHATAATDSDDARFRLQLDSLWLSEIMSAGSHFDLRKKFILWKILGEEPSEKREQLVARVEDSSCDQGSLAAMSNNFFPGSQKTDIISAHLLCSQYYEAEEYLKVLAETKYNPTPDITEQVERGFDFTTTIDKPNLQEGFYKLHRLICFIKDIKDGKYESMAPKETLLKIAEKLFSSYKAKLTIAAQTRGHQIFWANNSYGRAQQDAIKEITKKTGDCAETLDDTNEEADKLGEMLNALLPDTENPVHEIKKDIITLKDEFENLGRLITTELPHLDQLAENTYTVIVEEQREKAKITPQLARIDSLSMKILHGIESIRFLIGFESDPTQQEDIDAINKVLTALTQGLAEGLKSYTIALKTCDIVQKRRATVSTMNYFAKKWNIDTSPSKAKLTARF
ncbi:MAG: hypothetical protein HQM16_08120 [Deltaproteobacteria bacterium]|nr:hypothetical protein [Deltaproteobacteria bacterium]